MSDTPIPSPQAADIQPVKRISRIWLVPLVALFIGLWMLYYQWVNQGPLIYIEFADATGIEAEKTKIKTRNLDIGLVKKIELKEDLSGVIVTARIKPDADHLLREDSHFWIVTPRVSLSGISGLNTLLSGPYINLEPSIKGKKGYEFVALDEPPVTPVGTPGLHITLNSDDEFAFKEGDPIVYKGLAVGKFEDIYFNLEERVVYYNAFISAPYHALITENTKFWNTSGVRFELEASGINVQTGSLETLLTNGVTFGIPEGMPAGERITERAYFDIFPDYESASDERYTRGVNFAILIDETVRGLNVGAPVEYRGLKIGEVLAINPQAPRDNGLLDDGYSIPVIISIQPSRIQQADTAEGLEMVRVQTLHWISKGFRASLKMGNLLTGALYVDLQHYEDAEPVSQTSYLNYDVIPTRSDEFTQITQKVSALLDKFNAIPVEQLSANTNRALHQVNETVQSFQQMADNINVLLSDAKQQNLAAKLADTLTSINTLLADFSAGSESHEELINSMQSFQGTLQQLTPLLEQLNRAPNSLIFTEQAEYDIEPKSSQTKEKELE